METVISQTQMIVIMTTSALIVAAFSGKRLYTIWTHSTVICETLSHMGGGSLFSF